ncbi:MAG: hypothetical protein PUP91_37115 [Rhizonema sp. PD37]|nr:hypothetical protein [Rhizonema sp. PD37]
MSTEQPEEKKVGENSYLDAPNQGSWVERAEKFTKIAERFIWLFVLVIITTSVANFLKMQSVTSEKLLPVAERLPLERPIPPQVDLEIALALQDARIATESFASAKLESWEADVMKRVDDSFLPWYFGYWNQQILGLKYIFTGAFHWFNSNASAPEEAQTKLIQREFENRALPPEITQSVFSHIIEDSANLYTQELSQKIDAIPTHYKIPKGKWEKYLVNLSLITERSEANREVLLAEKGGVAAGLGGTYTISKVLKFGGAQALEAKLAAKGASKLAAKSGTKVAAKLGVEAVGTVLGIGIIVWDVWDHYHTKATQLPILRQNIKEYIEQVKTALLKDPQTGLISVIYDLENQVLKASMANRGV